MRLVATARKPVLAGLSSAAPVRSSIFFGGEKMRIDEMRELIGAELPSLDVQVSQIGENPHQRKVSGHRAAVNAARALRDTKALGPEIANVLKHETFVDGTDPIVVTHESANNFSNAVAQLRGAAHSAHRVLGALTLDTTETQVVLKLPKNSDLAGMVKDLEELNRLLSQAVLNDYVRGEIRVAGFDRGTEWLVIELASIRAVAMLFMMFKLLFWVGNRALDFEAKRQWIRGLKIDADTRKRFNDAVLGEFEEAKQEAFARVLKVAEIPVNEPELRERIKHSIAELDKLVKKGLEIGPVTKTPPELRVLLEDYKAFPPLPKQIEDGTAKVEDGNKDETE